MDLPTTIAHVAEPHAKYQSPYGADAALKRSYSHDDPDDHDEPDEKKPRHEPDVLENDELARIIAQATASATQQIERSTSQVLPTVEHDPLPQHRPMDVIQHTAEPVLESSAANPNDPHVYMRIMSLPILESLSTQIISTLARGPYIDTINIITQPESERGQAYAALKSLFDQTKKMYATAHKPFLSAYELGIRESEHQNIIRLTNVATFVSSVFGGQDVGFYELNDHFVETFVPYGGELRRELGMLYINLKTQMYLSAISQEEPEKTKEETLAYLFPSDVDRVLMARHPGAALTPHEVLHINDSQARRQHLQSQPDDADAISALSEEFSWEDFLKNLGDYLKQTYEPLVAPFMQRHGLSTHDRVSEGHESHEAASGVLPQPAPSNGVQDIVEQAARAAQVALQSVGYGAYPGAAHNTPPQQSPYQPPIPGPPHSHTGSPYPTGQVPYPTQSAPTQVLYEQARQAAVAKSSSHNRRPGLPSQRRPWTQEEENALMAGLDQVKGPHWSQILALYGPKGQVNEILKDRNQVQLKDKARNLKLFFLKSNIEVPYYLQCVTGELKTRAPSQAARKEAEERARLASEEEQARFNGIMALAGGMHGQNGSGGEGHAQHAQHVPPQAGSLRQDHVAPPKSEDHPPPPTLSYEESLGKQLMADIQKHDSAAAAAKVEPQS